MEKIGLLAGVGTLPVEFAEAVRSQGYEVVCVAVIPGIDPRLKEIANVYYDISAFKLNKIIKTLVKENVKEVTMIGKVTKEWLYKDHVLPDLRAIKVLNDNKCHSSIARHLRQELLERLQTAGRAADANHGERGIRRSHRRDRPLGLSGRFRALSIASG